MELRHLRYFVAVAEELHFRRAAERMHVAQPAVSEQIRKLELELGVKLFNRNQREVSLTVAGGSFLVEARHVLRQADVAVAAARGAGDEAGMRLRIGYLPDALPASVPRALRYLAASTPRLRVELERGQSHRMIEDLRSGRLDAVVTSLPAAVAKLRVSPLGSQRAVAVLPAGHELATNASLRVEWITRERLLVLPRDADPPFHDALIAACREGGLSPDFVDVGVPDVEHALLAVTAGAGIALLPASVATRYSPPGLRFVPLDGAAPSIECAVLTDPSVVHLGAHALLRALARVAKTQEAEPQEQPNEAHAA